MSFKLKSFFMYFSGRYDEKKTVFYDVGLRSTYNVQGGGYLCHP